jgi:hypothetical protein
MIDPLSGFGFNSIWSLTTLVVAHGVYPVMGYSTYSERSTLEKAISSIVLKCHAVLILYDGGSTPCL